MSNHTAKRRSGGGYAPPTALIAIDGASFSGSDNIEVDYTHQITASGFKLSDWITTPDGRTPVTITQLAPEALELGFGVSILDQTEITYRGTNSAFFHPDTVSMS